MASATAGRLETGDPKQERETILSRIPEVAIERFLETPPLGLPRRCVHGFESLTERQKPLSYAIQLPHVW